MQKGYQKTRLLIKCVIIIHKEEETLIVLENSGLNPEYSHSLTFNGRGRRRNILMDVELEEMRVWPGCNWLRIGSGCRMSNES
jgi:hypothetical protein